MKKLVAILAVFCLILGCFSLAQAAKPSITSQPETQTVKAGGTLTFTVKAKNAAGESITWYFLNPATGVTTTGKKLSSVVSGVKVEKPNSLRITLKKIPEELHGWVLYCHIGPKGGGANSNYAMILIDGKEVPPMPVQSFSSGKGGEPVVETPEPVEIIEPVVIKGSKVELYNLDSKGNPTGSPQTELNFPDGVASFHVRIPEGTEGTLQYVVVSGIRITPEGENVTGMSIRGLKESGTVKVKINRPSDGPESEEEEEIVPRPAQTETEPVDESSLVNVSCTYCRFTGGNNTYVESGKVPVGTTITVFASGGQIHKGYTINGGKAAYKDQASFQLVVEGDTTITMQQQK